MFQYRIHGLNISSELECPFLGKATGENDVTIRFGEIDSSGVEEQTKKEIYAIGSDTIYAHFKGISRYLSKGGREIIIEKYPEADDDHVRLFLLGVVLGITLHIRGFLPLHACAIAHEGKAILFMGESGTGKSTLAEAFRRKGYQLLSDDVCCTRIGDKSASMFPSISGINLSLDTMKFFQFPESEYMKGLYLKRKYIYLSEESFCDKEIELGKAYRIKTHESKEIIITKLNKFDKAVLLREQTYRKLAMQKLGRVKHHLDQCSRLSSMMDISVIERPDDISRLEDVVNALEQDFLQCK